MKTKIISFLFFLILSFSATAEKVCEHPPQELFDSKALLGLDNPLKDVKPKLQYKGFLSPRDLRKYSANTIAELLVDRIQEGCDKVRGGSDEEDMSEHSEVMMMVNSNLYDSIDKYGLQNQHVTATTKGCDCRENRYNAETKMIGGNIGYGSKAKDILPKYSGLNVLKKSHFNDPSSAYNGASYYGNTAIVFKDTITERTTFTPWDSLGTRQFRGSPILSSLKFRDKVKKNEHFRCSSSYCEAQIWGKVTLDDVKYVLIPEGHKVPEVFKKRGVPVYFNKNGKKGTMAWEKGKSAYKVEKKGKHVPKSIFDDPYAKPSVVKNINDHHNYKNWIPIKLKNMLTPGLNSDQRREILGELAVREFPDKKQYFEDKFNKSSSGLEKVIALQALSEYPKSIVLNKIISDKIKSISENGFSYFDPQDMMLMSLIVEVEPFKSNKEFQNILKKGVENNSSTYTKQFYQYLTTDKNMCDEVL